MKTFPVELCLEGREALVVGTGHELTKKIDALLEAGARVTVIASAPDEAIRERAERGAVNLVVREPKTGDTEGKAIVFVASDHPIAAALHTRAVTTCTLVCNVDRPEHSTFVSNAVVRAGGLTMTIASGGASPGVLRRVREDLTSLFADERLAAFMSTLRARREELPRGERAEKLGELVRGFAVEARLRFPDWFESSYAPKR